MICSQKWAFGTVITNFVDADKEKSKLTKTKYERKREGKIPYKKKKDYPKIFC